MDFRKPAATLGVMAAVLAPGIAKADTILMMDGTGNGDPYPFTNPTALGYTGLTPAERDAVLDGYFKGRDQVSIATPEEWGPLFGTEGLGQSTAEGTDALDAAIKATPGPKVVYGVSQSAIIVSEEKRKLMAAGDTTEQLSFVVEGNPDRPDGGFATRIPGLAAFLGLSSDGPPETPYDTIDVAEEYDPISDFPNYPTNLLADANAVVGFAEHPNYTATSTQVHPDITGLTPQSVVTNSLGGTTTYYLVPTDTLPLLQPLAQVGVPKQVVSGLNAVLKPLVDAGYDRDPSQVGTVTRAQLVPKASVIKKAVKAEVKAIKSLFKHTHGKGKS